MKPTKVAYNACFGGFGLSKEAVLLARQMSGNPKWGGCVIGGEMFKDGSGPASPDLDEWGCDLEDGFPRHDPILVSVIEKLGKKAGGDCSNLVIRTVTTPYRIDEYHGNESVMTADDYEWVTP